MPRSLSRQVFHYLSRPHEEAPRGAVEGAAAWLGSEMAARADTWQETLDDAEVDEALETARAASRLARAGQTPSKSDLPMPRLERRIARWRHELSRGRGFVLIRGVPVNAWSPEEAERFFWALGLHLGVPGVQNEKGDLIGHVVDRGASGDQRLYETAKTIRYHCDTCDVVGLLCLRTAREGGASRIASSVTVYNRLLAEDPALARGLFETFALDAHGQRGIDTMPVIPCRYAGGTLRTFYHADYFRSGGAKAGTLTDARRRLLDRYDAIAESPDVRLDMDLREGDIQLVSNHTVVHARTGYVDHAEPARRRHLLRLWLSLEEDAPAILRARRAMEGARVLARLAGAKLRARRA